MFIFPFVLIFFLAIAFPALSFADTKFFNFTFVPNSILVLLALTVGTFFLYGFFGSGSVGSQSVNFPFVIGVNDGRFIGSSLFLPQKITTFVPTAQWS